MKVLLSILLLIAFPHPIKELEADRVHAYVIVNKANNKLALIKDEKVVKILPQISTMIMGVFLIIFVLIVLTPIMEVYMGSFLFDAYL